MDQFADLSATASPSSAAPAVGPEPLRYRVGGMDCPSCVAKVETALRRLPGVDAISLNYQSQLLKLTLDPAATPREGLEQVIRALGYTLQRLDGLSIVAADGTTIAEEADSAAGTPWWLSPKLRITLVIGLLVAAGWVLPWLLPTAEPYALLPAALAGLAVFGRRALLLARTGSPFSIEMLMVVATLGAIAIGETAEASVVVLLFAIGELLEGVAAGRARSGIRALTALVPRMALLVEEGGARAIPAARVEVGQTLLVRPGDRVPADGTISDGRSDLDESPITGESVPVTRGEGDTVLAGSINRTGALQIRVTRAAADNTIARIIRMVEEAEASRAPTARFIERFSARYTPLVILIALLTVLIPPLVAGADWQTWIYRGLAVLLIGCPCALVLSTPAAITSGIAAGARRGLLIKGGAALEAMGHMRTVAFDKTGTLTRGEPQVTDLVLLSGSDGTLMGLAAAVETGSSHPIARAILAKAAAEAVPPRPVREQKAQPGRAAEGIVIGRRVEVGSVRHALERGASLPLDRVEALEAAGKTVVAVLADGQALGLIAVRDEPRPDAARALARLRALGVRTLMLTGDNARTAAAIADGLGIEVQAGLLPEDKLRAITDLKQDGPVAMVGDGINDGPALAAADVGVAMGGGTDVALESADAALLGSRVDGVADMITLSRATLRTIHQNVVIALGLKAVFLVTTLAGVTGLWLAVLADTGATVIVTLNAMRLLASRSALR
ncbi:heavy metal translocating P-type ATPase [Oleisolibacter albus]|uniref:heavy metal translocating P-type ATPase n=1 Tax=Oleisolibacter albus TaxID=2171757 RepID=UPI000DF1DEEF|nr:heavy metal translocating P-type ATPase [Oleisolibacter albus]